MKKGSKTQYPPTSSKGPTESFPADKLKKPMTINANESQSRDVLRKNAMLSSTIFQNYPASSENNKQERLPGQPGRLDI
jgi:hypothetical protein